MTARQRASYRWILANGMFCFSALFSVCSKCFRDASIAMSSVADKSDSNEHLAHAFDDNLDHKTAASTASTSSSSTSALDECAAVETVIEGALDDECNAKRLSPPLQIIEAPDWPSNLVDNDLDVGWPLIRRLFHWGPIFAMSITATVCIFN